MRLTNTIRSALARAGASVSPIVWSALFCSLLLILLLRLWQADLHVPMIYGSDAILFLSMVKGMMQGQWIWANSHLAAPFGLELWDLPIFITLDAAGMKILTLFTRSPGLVLNLTWLLGTILAAGSMTWCMRRLGINSWIATSIGVIFALQTFGFASGVIHLHCLYYLVPFIATGTLELASRGLSIHRPSEDPTSKTSRAQRLFTLVPRYLWLACIGIGLSYAYNAFFSCFLLLAASVLAFMARRNWRDLLSGMGTVLLIGVVSLVNLSPALYHQVASGKNVAMDFKRPLEEEVWGLRIHDLLIPIPEHPFRPLRRIYEISEKVGFQPDRESTYSKLGITGSLGFLFLLGLLLRAAMRGSVGGSREDSLLGASAALMLFCLLLATIGGFGSLFNVFVTPDIRCYARIVPFIDYFCLTAVAFLLTRLWQWWRAKSLSVTIFCVALAAVTILAAADQAMVTQYRQYESREQTFYQDEAFVQAIERSLPRGAAIFQLPFISFPIGRQVVGKIEYYDQGKPYIHSTDLRWSWGAMRGRAGDEWIRSAAALPVPEMLHELVHAGFSGVWVDRFGYTDGLSPEAQLSRVLETAPVRSVNERFLFYDLRSFAAQVMRQEASVNPAELFASHPVEIIPDGGFFADEQDAVQHCATRKGSLILRNQLGIPRQVKLQATLKTQGPGRLKITSSQQSDEIVIPGAQTYERELLLPAGSYLRLNFSCNCTRVNATSSARPYYFSLVNLRVGDPPNATGKMGAPPAPFAHATFASGVVSPPRH